VVLSKERPPSSRGARGVKLRPPHAGSLDELVVLVAGSGSACSVVLAVGALVEAIPSRNLVLGLLGSGGVRLEQLVANRRWLAATAPKYATHGGEKRSPQGLGSTKPSEGVK